MRYSGWALLLFGAGGVLGLVLVSANLTALGWTASATMAAGIAALPVTLVADWWSHRPWRKPPAKRRVRSSRRSKPSPPRKRRAKGK
ncbi:MAG TPA: hypothetical protein VNV38_01560 [Stellaceae bacterium]|jgi:hypothetical protein|nr:hypothetical protein [Stellaceae bacterium]